MSTFNFTPPAFGIKLDGFRAEVRAFLAEHIPDVPAPRLANSWGNPDPEFSRVMGAHGLIGLTWPKRYGGHERSALERYVLLEEVLAAGAPVGAHWIADRQSGPSLMRYGSEAQCQRYLPRIAAGELFTCIGMSEPGSGSDLASVSTRAECRPDGSWLLNGQKVWTTFAQYSELMIALVRTEPRDSSRRHAGLSQFLIELDTPGVTVRPIVNLAGDEDFNEVFFEDVVLPPEALLGEEGDGWRQCTAELALERSGPERYLSSLALFLQYLDHVGSDPSAEQAQAIGEISAQLWTLRQMSLAVAARLEAGEDPAVEAACVKDLGNSLEQSIPPRLQGLLSSSDVVPGDGSALGDSLALLLQSAPSFSLRGGTREILRGIVARGMGVR